VLATPALIMYLEMVSRDLAKHHLDPGYDTVGTHVDVKHLAATPIGIAVTYHAELIEAGERRLRFRVEAFDEREKVGEGFHERAIVNIAKFSERVRAKAESVVSS
jgi:predicted thioesterase